MSTFPLTELRRALRPYRSVFLVYDRNVEAYALQIASLRPDAPLYPLTADETHKTPETALDICRWLLAQGADRKALLLAVGGGITTDLAGFAACIYKRGIRYANVPTTLLAQVDAGLGGKTGANLDGYKNMVGVICQPEFSCILPETLHTLPDRAFRSGVAELLKTFLIGDATAYKAAISLLREGRPEASDPRLAALIARAAAIKNAIVIRDEREHGRRRVLNLGHTYAHAIEWYQQTHPVSDPLTHGEAVSVGLVCAARLSERLGLAEEGLAGCIEADLSACGLPTTLPCPESALEAAIHKDKKAEGDKVCFVLLRSIGHVVLKKI